MGKIRSFSRRARWSDVEVELLKERYATTRRQDLAELFPERAIRNVECKANSLGLVRAKKPKRSREEYLKAKRDGMARHRAKDIEAARAYSRQYHHANREKQTEKMRLYGARRFFWTKAMKLRGRPRATARDLAALWKAQCGLCALTGRRLDRTAQLDHKLPRARGGGDEILNLQWVCDVANLAKRDLTDAEFAELCGEVVHWIGERIACADNL